jgi:hypothetical protein
VAEAEGVEEGDNEIDKKTISTKIGCKRLIANER